MVTNHLAKMSASSRRASAAALIAIAAIAMYGWIVAPYTASLRAAQRYESGVDMIAQKNETIAQTVKAKQEILKKLREGSIQFQSTFFTADRANQFFSDLQAISQEAGCTVYSLNLPNTQANPGARGSQQMPDLVARSAILTVVGSYENLIKLIERLQARSERVWIDALQIETIDYRSAQPRCEITITVYTMQEKESDS